MDLREELQSFGSLVKSLDIMHITQYLSYHAELERELSYFFSQKCLDLHLLLLKQLNLAKLTTYSVAISIQFKQNSHLFWQE